MELSNSLCVVLLQLSVSVSSPGLPVTLPNENYQCHFQNEEMAVSFVVPAEESLLTQTITVTSLDKFQLSMELKQVLFS